MFESLSLVLSLRAREPRPRPCTDLLPFWKAGYKVMPLYPARGIQASVLLIILQHFRQNDLSAHRLSSGYVPVSDTSTTEDQPSIVLKEERRLTHISKR